MACVAVSSLMRTIELEFLQPQPRPILQEDELFPCNKELVQSLCQKLGSVIKLFDENIMEGVKAIQHLERRLRDVAFRVEDEIEVQIAHLYETQEEFGIPQGDTDAQKSCHSFKLHRILQQAIDDIDAIEKELMKIKNKDRRLKGIKTVLNVLPRSEVDSSQRASHSENKMVGKDKEFEDIKEMLIKHPSPDLETVSIEGMGGIGKTMLARRVYEDWSIVSRFELRAWVFASQKRQMLVDLLNSVRYAEWDGDNNDLALQLHRALRGKRYLVVVDDLWSTSAWDAIKVCLPNDNNSSRVLLTTRISEVARYASFNYNFSYQIRLLNWNESWNLFLKKAYFGTFARPSDIIEDISHGMVGECNGLPLAIFMVAGILSKLNTQDELRNIYKYLNSFEGTIDEKCSRILSFSYNHLPHNLKTCFLYLGIFPKDKVIYVKDVVRLWAVEGLIKGSENMSLNEVGERHICELLDRNLILVSKQSGYGRKIKAFKMHDLVHAFCEREAQNENILHVVTENCSNFPLQGFRWLSIQSPDFDTRTIYSSSLKCRSIFCFTEAKSLYLKSFNLLRVFYSTDVSMCKKIVDMVHLRYLPPVFRHFRTLTLLKAWNFHTFSIYAYDGRNYSMLKPYNCTIEFFTKNSHLKEVLITGERRECNDRIDNLVYLPRLEGLYVNGNVWGYRTLERIQINFQIARLKSLKTLSFRSMNFEWEGINVVCQLPMLEVLRLFSSGIGEKWKLTGEDVFSQLFVLEILLTDLKHWEASSDNFPKLERLRLHQCSQLREIPADFAFIYTLTLIKLTRCHSSAVMSTKQIREDQLEYGIDNIIVIEKDTIKSNDIESPD